jgi:hypothetical protein
MKTPTKPYKRLSPRFKCQLEGIMCPLEKGENPESALDVHRKHARVTACDMSREGLCLTTHVTLHRGDRVKLDVHTSESVEPIPCVAEVCWSRAGQSGLRIVSLTEAGRGVLQKQIRTATFSVRYFGPDGPDPR